MANKSGDQASFNEAKPERRSPAEVLRATRQILGNVQLGLGDIKATDPSRRSAGLHNVVVFGRAVTISLQRLKNVAPGFSDWYGEVIPENDPLLDYINTLRIRILKQGVVPRVKTSFQIDSFSGNLTEVLQGEPPAGWSEMFIGDGLGGSGWILNLPDGTQAKYYADLNPSFPGSFTSTLDDAPSEFLGEPLTDTTIAGVTSEYVGWLEKLVAEAERRFGSP